MLLIVSGARPSVPSVIAAYGRSVLTRNGFSRIKRITLRRMTGALSHPSSSTEFSNFVYFIADNVKYFTYCLLNGR